MTFPEEHEAVEGGKDKQPRKRIRTNHNELERIRRNALKTELEELRLRLPFTDMDSRTPVVKIVAHAREYIGLLEQRINELQTILNSASAGHGDAGASASRSGEEHGRRESSDRHALGLPSRSRFGSMSADQIHMHQGVPFYNPGFMQVPGTAHPLASPRKSLSPLAGEETLNADLLLRFLTDGHPEAFKQGKRLSSDDEGFLKAFRARRESSLLLPLREDKARGESDDRDDAPFLLQKRDSVSILFSGASPEIVDGSLLGHEISCGHCRLGINNLIMIDCDRCRKWYHIRCAGIDSNFIPTVWHCHHCRGPAKMQ